jgi:tetratricopeptide (TPR) repeat protein
MLRSALSLLEAGDITRSLAIAQHSVALDPSNADAFDVLGRIQERVGRLDLARQSFERAVTLNPSAISSAFNLGAVADRLGDSRAAIDAYRLALQTAPGLQAAALRLASLLAAVGDETSAIALYRQVLAQSPDCLEALICLGVRLVYADRADEAELLLERATALDAESVDAWRARATAFQHAGRSEDELNCLRRALQLAPRDAQSLASLLSSSALVDEVVIERAATVAVDPSVPKAARRMLLGALARRFDREGRYDDAILRSEAAALLQDERGPFRGSSTEGLFDALHRVFEGNGPLLERRAPTAAVQPVFVVGMPRSGTTLVEQVLASHPLVAGAGEQEFFVRLAQRLARILDSRYPYPDCIQALDGERCVAIEREYLCTLARYTNNVQRVVDKMPLNFLHLGLIAMVCPSAAIIHCVREPLDTCLSIYLEQVRLGEGFAHDLGNIGLIYRRYERLMRLWERLIGQRILTVRYEDLVSDLAGVSRQLVAHCGLVWSPTCLSFHQTQRAILTPSNWQVRRPLYRTSVGRWRNYRRHLGPLRDALSA